MHFLPDMYVPCDVCHGARYNRETLEILYKGKNITQVLDMTVEDAHGYFSAVPNIARKLQTLLDVGLGYIKLGQSATTLSGGEAQRVKLALELSKRDTGRTLYILDEPTTGLHFHDIAQLLKVLHQLRDAGNTIVVIEHNLDVIKTADWLIDMGPEGGAGGGELLVAGTPEQVAAHPRSHTGRFLADPSEAASTGRPTTETPWPRTSTTTSPRNRRGPTWATSASGHRAACRRADPRAAHRPGQDLPAFRRAAAAAARAAAPGLPAGGAEALFRRAGAAAEPAARVLSGARRPRRAADPGGRRAPRQRRGHAADRRGAEGRVGRAAQHQRCRHAGAAAGGVRPAGSAAGADAQGDAVQQRYDQATQQAFDAGVFGAPSYVIDGEIFWGQDRLDFVERRLAARREAADPNRRKAGRPRRKKGRGACAATALRASCLAPTSGGR